MHDTTAAFSAHLQAPVTGLATCWRLRRRDGVTLGFTTHDRELEFEGLTYRPSHSAEDGLDRRGASAAGSLCGDAARIVCSA